MRAGAHIASTPPSHCQTAPPQLRQTLERSREARGPDALRKEQKLALWEDLKALSAFTERAATPPAKGAR